MKKVLFVCIGNSCRSQMAEGFMRLHGKRSFEPLSAGTAACGVVNRDTAAAMKEAGVDISDQTSKQLTDDMIDEADAVVTLGCIPASRLCPPSYAGKMYDWKIEDPLGMGHEFMERVRDDIEKRVVELIRELKDGDGKAAHTRS